MDIRRYVLTKYTLERDIPLLQKAQALALSIATEHPNAFWTVLNFCSRLRVLELARDNLYLDAYLRHDAGEILDPTTLKILENRGFVERIYVVEGQVEGKTLSDLVENVKRRVSYKFVPKSSIRNLLRSMPCKVTMSNYADIAVLQREGIVEVIAIPKGLFKDIIPINVPNPLKELRSIVNNLPPHHLQFVSDLLNKIVLKTLDQD